jgi:Tol biopolymer transport system component
MPLSTGTTIGPYQVLAPLGEGGMGEVYRARDRRLNRDGAIKILPDLFAADPDRLARFEREAQLLATLNHPNIAHVHGFEESPAGAGRAGLRALVMELVEGSTLAERLAAGPISLDEALPIARQIAEALEAAHAQGIVHRDLKPANIKIDPSGTVKVLDFGLARAGGATGPGGDLLNSPTITSPAMTQAGVILGTAAYMAPEQARGKVVDHRADVWAFGVVLFEMITGTRAFEGAEVTDVLASVLKSDPKWTALPADAPAALRRLIRRCLERDPKRRLQAIGEARIQIDDLIGGAAEELPVQARPAAVPSIASRVVPWTLALVSASLAIATLLVWAPWRPAASPSPMRVSVELGSGATLAFVNLGAAAVLSPDGTTLAFVGGTSPGSPRQLFVRRLSEMQATPLAGTEAAANPFFSPDGQWLAFFSSDKLKRVAVTGGAVATITDAPNSRGGAWSQDGTIVVSENRSGLFRVPSRGGTREPLTALASGEITHRYPQILLGGRAVLYTAHTAPDNFDDASIVVQPLPSGPPTVVHRGGYYGRYLPSGHVAYIHKQTLFVAPLDLDRLEVTGPSVPVIENVEANSARGEAQFAFSNTGTLVYLGSRGSNDGLPLLWFDRQGKAEPLRSTPGRFSTYRIAPDGQRIAMTLFDGTQEDVWIYDSSRDTMSRLTFDPAVDSDPVWTPDGRRIVYASHRGPKGAPLTLYWQRADGTGEAVRLVESENAAMPFSWHPSGRFLLYQEGVGVASAGGLSQRDTNLMILPVEGSEDTGWKFGAPTPFLKTPLPEFEPMFSPDGRWVAYSSLETGSRQVFVRPFQGSGGRWQVSTAGGTNPVWSRARAELLFRAADSTIMTVEYSASESTFRSEKPRPWMEGVAAKGVFPIFDLHPDGKRVAAPPMRTVEDRPATVAFLFNFSEELKRRAPVATRR